MSKIKIRFAIPSDLDELVRLSVLFNEHFHMLDGTVSNGSAQSNKALIKKLNFSKNPLMRTLIAELEGRIIGAISFYKGFTVDTGEVYHFPYFFIRPEYRGSRAALFLFDSIKKIAKKEKIKFIAFSVYGKNKNAVKLYEHIRAKYWANDDEHFMYLEL